MQACWRALEKLFEGARTAGQTQELRGLVARRRHAMTAECNRLPRATKRVRQIKSHIAWLRRQL